MDRHTAASAAGGLQPGSSDMLGVFEMFQQVIQLYDAVAHLRNLDLFEAAIDVGGPFDLPSALVTRQVFALQDPIVLTPPTGELLAEAGGVPLPIHPPGRDPHILGAQPAGKQARRESWAYPHLATLVAAQLGISSVEGKLCGLVCSAYGFNPANERDPANRASTASNACCTTICILSYPTILSMLCMMHCI